MKLFHRQYRDLNADTHCPYVAFEIAHTKVDVAAALCFLVGSMLFFWPAWETLAIWFLVIGSVFFMAKPTLRLAHEIKLYRMGKVEELAGRPKD